MALICLAGIHHAYDTPFGQNDVAHPNGPLVMRNHHLREVSAMLCVRLAQ